MADNKLEQMLEKLVNNDRAGADELFHEFVIEKSRGIYEKMLESDLEDLDEVKDEEVDESSDDEETNEASDEEVDESSDDEETNEATDEEVDESDEDLDETTDEEVDENFGEITPEADPMGGDAGDAMMSDIEADGDEGDMDDKMDGDEEEIEDRVVDLEDALDDLKSEFEKMMAGDNDGEEGDEDDAEEMPDMDPEGDEDKDEAYDVGSELSVEDEAPAFEGTKTAGEQMREYVEKVTPNMGDTGTDGTKSPVAGKNDMGGTTANIAKGGTGSEKGSAMSAKEDNMGNVNVPGGKASKSMSANAKGHGAEKKGAGETGTNSKSTIGS
jgi:hypothetical protein